MSALVRNGCLINMIFLRHLSTFKAAYHFFILKDRCSHCYHVGI